LNSFLNGSELSSASDEYLNEVDELPKDAQLVCTKIAGFLRVNQEK